jgi:hypothetical protein
MSLKSEDTTDLVPGDVIIVCGDYWLYMGLKSEDTQAYIRPGFLLIKMM